MANTWHSDSCQLKDWDTIKDSIGHFPDNGSHGNKNGLPNEIAKDEVVSGYLEGQKAYVNVLEGAYRATCKCQAAVLFRRKKEMSTLSDTDARIVISKLTSFVFYDATPRTYNISQENFWAKLSKLKDFDDYHLPELKDFFRDKLFGRLLEYGYQAGAITKFIEIINADIDDSEVWENEFSKLLCGDTKFNPEDLDFWKLAFFTNYKLFNPAVSFQDNVNKLRNKCQERLNIDKSLSRIHSKSCVAEGEFPLDDEDSFYGKLDEKLITMEAEAQEQNKEGEVGNSVEPSNGNSEGQSECLSPDPKRIKLAETSEEIVHSSSSVNTDIEYDNKIIGSNDEKIKLAFTLDPTKEHVLTYGIVKVTGAEETNLEGKGESELTSAMNEAVSKEIFSSGETKESADVAISFANECKQSVESSLALQRTTASEENALVFDAKKIPAVVVCTEIKSVENAEVDRPENLTAAVELVKVDAKATESKHEVLESPDVSTKATGVLSENDKATGAQIKEKDPDDVETKTEKSMKSDDPRMIRTDVNKAMATALQLVDMAANMIEASNQKKQYAYFFIAIFKIMFQLKQKVCAAGSDAEKTKFLTDGAPKSRIQYQKEFQIMISLMTVPNRELVEIGRGFYGCCVMLGDLMALP